MNYTIALNSMPDSSSQIALKSNHIATTAFTKVLIEPLTHNASYKSITAINKIKSFAMLEDNWDTYGAESISKIAINNAISFVDFADRYKLFVFFCSPGRNGDVMLEYKLSNNKSMEIYFNENKTNEFYIYSGNECINEGTFEENYLDIIKIARNNYEY